MPNWSAGEFVHFACTSEDINNTSHALMLKAAREQVLLPALDRMLAKLHGRWRRPWPHCPCSAAPRPDRQPHHGGQGGGQRAGAPATARARIAAVPLLAKMNGAVGNYNAHLAAYPDFDWEAFSRRWWKSAWAWPSTLHDPDRAARLHGRAVRRHDALQHLLIDWSRDVWGYISLGYFKQRLKKGEVGSSTMPHKVNPIDFENAEGNFGLANALLTPHEPEAAHQPLAARPDRQHRAAQHGRGAGLRVLACDSLAAAWTSWKSTPPRWPPTWTPPGKCWPNRCRP
jgi:adenylosuccinate lyase